MNSPATDDDAAAAAAAADIQEYMVQLTQIEIEALQVARKCLPNTFRIRETAGFKDFLAQRGP